MELTDALKIAEFDAAKQRDILFRQHISHEIFFHPP
jgi:hypothetical protein